MEKDGMKGSRQRRKRLSRRSLLLAMSCPVLSCCVAAAVESKFVQQSGFALSLFGAQSLSVCLCVCACSPISNGSEREFFFFFLRPIGSFCLSRLVLACASVQCQSNLVSSWNPSCPFSPTARRNFLEETSHTFTFLKFLKGLQGEFPAASLKPEIS